ncbi:MAG: Uma2 family endonuclease [Lachnospiraceae bacterium]|nr:Uma2 family endonuclease [Lachnospiraceae bacterium]
MTVEEMKKRKMELGYSYEQIAELSGLPVGTVQKVLGGITKTPRYRTLQALQRAFVVEDRLNDPGARQNTRKNTVPADYMIREETAPYDVSSHENGIEKDASVPDGTADASHGAFVSKGNSAGFGALIEAEGCLYDDFEPEDYKVEWINGERYDRSLPGPLHQILVMGIWRSFLESIRKNQASCSALAALSAVLSDGNDRTVVWPDVMLLCDQEKVRQGRVYGAPDLVVEVVSGDSLIRDSHLKLSRYEHAGVREYWLVYPGQKSVVVYDFKKEEDPRIYGFTETVPVGVLDGACAVNFAEIIGYIED